MAVADTYEPLAPCSRVLGDTQLVLDFMGSHVRLSSRGACCRRAKNSRNLVGREMINQNKLKRSETSNTFLSLTDELAGRDLANFQDF